MLMTKIINYLKKSASKFLVILIPSLSREKNLGFLRVCRSFVATQDDRKGVVPPILFILPAVLLIFLGSLAPAGEAGAVKAGLDDPQALFLAASQSYQDENYARAGELYREVLNLGITSGHLLYNLGNCYFRQGDLGRALLFYRRAQIYIPRDADLQVNINTAVQERADKIEPAQTGIKRVFLFWYFGLSPREMIYAFVAVNIFCWLAFSWYLFRGRDWMRWVLIGAGIFWVLLGTASAVKMAGLSGPRSGVVLEPEIEVRSGYSRHDTVLFQLHEGAEFKIEGEERGWLKIRLADGKRGWINGDFAGVVEDFQGN